MNTYSPHKDDALSAVKLLIKELQIDCINVRDQLENIGLILIISVVLACCFAVIRFGRLWLSTTIPRKKNAPPRAMARNDGKKSTDMHIPINYYMPF